MTRALMTSSSDTCIQWRTQLTAKVTSLAQEPMKSLELKEKQKTNVNVDVGANVNVESEMRRVKQSEEGKVKKAK